MIYLGEKVIDGTLFSVFLNTKTDTIVYLP